MLAERGGFEPPVDFKGLRRFSKPLLSTTQPPLRKVGFLQSDDNTNPLQASSKKLTLKTIVPAFTLKTGAPVCVPDSQFVKDVRISFRKIGAAHLQHLSIAILRSRRRRVEREETAASEGHRSIRYFIQTSFTFLSPFGIRARCVCPEQSATAAITVFLCRCRITVG